MKRDYYPSADDLHGELVVITEKMDGENTTMYHDYIHARSLDSPHHSSQSWVKGFHSGIRDTIPDGIRICGENLYAQHSIPYDNLPSYFLAFSVWQGDRCWGWDPTINLLNSIGIETVPILYIGICMDDILKDIIDDLDLTRSEGIVVRLYDGFTIDEFPSSTAKWVRPNHIQTNDEWKTQVVIPNRLRS